METKSRSLKILRKGSHSNLSLVQKVSVACVLFEPLKFPEQLTVSPQCTCTCMCSQTWSELDLMKHQRLQN